MSESESYKVNATKLNEKSLGRWSWGVEGWIGEKSEDGEKSKVFHVHNAL